MSTWEEEDTYEYSTGMEKVLYHKPNFNKQGHNAGKDTDYGYLILWFDSTQGNPTLYSWQKIAF
jgi:hypothetical protein